MSVGQEFWIVSAGCRAAGDSEKDNYFGQLKGQSALASRGEGVWKFDVPDGDRALRFGSFDSLIRLTDDLQKIDAQVESIVHRLERQYLEVDPKAEFKMIFKRPQRHEKSLMEYLTKWQWDESRYSKTDSIGETLTALWPKMTKLDEEARKKTAEYSDLKQQKANLSKKDGTNIMTADLVDILTPAVVTARGNENDDFIYSKYLTTVVVILPRGTDKDFLKAYESFTPTVVPQSAKLFPNLADKDGSVPCRVVLCTKFEAGKVEKETNHVDNFKRACRERRFAPRDFEFSEDGYKQILQQRERVNKEVENQKMLVTGIYRDAWSDVMHALVHIKAMRVFVESVLRFGMPPRFASFILAPPTANPAPARKALADILGKGVSGAFASGEKEEGDDEEFFPYVSLSFIPLSAPKA